MYRFPQGFTNDRKANKICQEHINNVLLKMIDRHIYMVDGKGKMPKVEIAGEEANHFFPEEYRDYEDMSIITDKFLTLRAILKDKKDITPELLLEYVVALMSTREVYYARVAVMNAMVAVVEDDELKDNISKMYDHKKTFDIKKVCKYPSKRMKNDWNDKNDENIFTIYNNVRNIVNDMIEVAICKNDQSVYTKKESLRFLDLVRDGEINSHFSGSTLIEADTKDNDFVFEMYIKKCGHPAVYKISEINRKYVVEMVEKFAKEILEESCDVDEDVAQEEIDDFVNEYMEEIEDTRTYEGSEKIFWDTDYAMIDNIGLDKSIDLFANIMGDGSSIGGIRFK